MAAALTQELLTGLLGTSTITDGSINFTHVVSEDSNIKDVANNLKERKTCSQTIPTSIFDQSESTFSATK